MELAKTAPSKSNLPMLLDPGTKGGSLFLSLVLFLVPIGIYQGVLSSDKNLDPLVVGKFVSFFFIVIAVGLWTSTYLFRVAKKETVYSKQLRQYEDGVIAERLRELEALDEDERDRILRDLKND